MVKTSPSGTGAMGSTPGWGGSHMPQGQKTKTSNGSNNVTNSIKTLKMVHIKNILKKIINYPVTLISISLTTSKGSLKKKMLQNL